MRLTKIRTATGKDVKIATAARNPYSSKHDNGSIVVVGGSGVYHGAPVLAGNAAWHALAALRVGIGYAYLYVPSSIVGPVRALSPNLIVRPFGTESIGDGKISGIRQVIMRADALVIGIGIGKGIDVLKKAGKIIDYAVSNGKRVVIDADGLFSIKYAGSLGMNALITPNDREFEMLEGGRAGNTVKERAASAMRLSARIGTAVLLKGHVSVISDGKEAVTVNPKSSALATAGTGDVLSGIIGGYMASGASTFRAGIAGAYVHAKAGDMLYKKMGAHILADDLINMIPHVIKHFDRQSIPHANKLTHK